ncbi:hypothetical protein EJ03DRAFT_325894 [Teratosphaeria nubilosa]|uniref:Uncharacterized protein n=1 Tax=Teratosphaeria nubilosa TaxID=161662 RepID=A0A6G1LEQ3_9PEZI|nr:hypothetical protein EJ03DRAFT_325894 [Teratosphaeria nubilosa]
MVRPSARIEIRAKGKKPLSMHLVMDGTTKTRAQMHEENYRRNRENAQLEQEERRFPQLSQTVARKEAWNCIRCQIIALRRDTSFERHEETA